MIHETPRQRVLRRCASLRDGFDTWRPTLEDLARHINPHRARFDSYKFGEGTRLDDAIINNTPTVALRILASGMMAAITSPARRWFKLTTPDPELAEFGPARLWLHLVEERMRWVFGRSNVYQAFADGTYPDLGLFGFHASILEESEKNIIRAEVLAVGEYYLAVNDDGIVDTIYRELPMTVRQVVRRFGLDNISPAVRNSWDRSDYERVVNLVHAIYPNEDYEPNRADRYGKKWASDWLEKGGRDDKFLRRSGYEEFPGLCPRWLVRAHEAYGRGPGWEVLGDCKALQFQEEKLAMLVDKTVDPPMVGGPDLEHRRASLLPGDVTYTAEGDGGFKPALQIPPAAITATQMHIDRHERRIMRGMYAELFARLLNDERAQRATATEIDALRQETMLQLGPVIERLGPELLKPVIDRTFSIMTRLGLMPEAPEELQGIELKVEFESILHAAQKSYTLGSVRVFMAELGNLVALVGTGSTVLDKVNTDEIVDELREMTGIKPDLVVSDEDVAKVRAERAKQAEAAQASAAMSEMASGVSTLAKAPAPAPDNAAGAVLAALGPLAGLANVPGGQA